MPNRQPWITVWWSRELVRIAGFSHGVIRVIDTPGLHKCLDACLELEAKIRAALVDRHE